MFQYHYMILQNNPKIKVPQYQYHLNTYCFLMIIQGLNFLMSI